MPRVSKTPLFPVAVSARNRGHRRPALIVLGDDALLLLRAPRAPPSTAPSTDCRALIKVQKQAELITVCSLIALIEPDFRALQTHEDGAIRPVSPYFSAAPHGRHGHTPEEAVARLWLALRRAGVEQL